MEINKAQNIEEDLVVDNRLIEKVSSYNYPGT